MRNFLHVDVNSVCFVVHLRSIWDPGILPSGHIVKALLARKGWTDSSFSKILAAFWKHKEKQITSNNHPSRSFNMWNSAPRAHLVGPLGEVLQPAKNSSPFDVRYISIVESTGIMAQTCWRSGEFYWIATYNIRQEIWGWNVIPCCFAWCLSDLNWSTVNPFLLPCLAK